MIDFEFLIINFEFKLKGPIIEKIKNKFMAGKNDYFSNASDLRSV
jgi:hypothetical protein